MISAAAGRDDVLARLDARAFYSDHLDSFHPKDRKQVTVLCPFHEDSDPSLHVDQESGVFYCFGCGAKGSPIDFVMRVQGVEFPEALGYLAGYVGMNGEPHTVRPAPVRKAAPVVTYQRPADLDEQIEAFALLLWNADVSNEKVLHLTKDRGLSSDVILAARLGHNGMRYTIPVFDASGKSLFIRTYLPKQERRESDRKMLSPLGRSAALYGAETLKAIPDGALVLVLGGELDALRARTLGYHAISGTGGETCWRDDWSEALARFEIVVAFDNDDAGERGSDKTVASLRNAGVRAAAIVWPADTPPKTDLSDFTLKQGHSREEFSALIESALKSMEVVVQTSTTAGAAPTPAESVTGQSWPKPLDPAAYHGLTGDIVAAIDPVTESDPAAILMQFLVYVGNVIGPSPHYVVEDNRHPMNLYAVLVGTTSKGRKGTSAGRVRSVVQRVDPDWAKHCIAHGLSSGEGLINEVRDAVPKHEAIRGADNEVTGYRTVYLDPGVTDKRLLVVEPEFAQVLRVMQREGNTLSVVVRQAWDGGDTPLKTMTKNSPVQATGAYISIIGHISRDELRRELNRTDAASGFGNRFLWFAVRRSKLLPEGADLDQAIMDRLGESLRLAVHDARRVGRIKRDPEATARWADVYGELSEGRPGMLGAVTSRAEAQVTRLSVLYALLDRETTIRLPHLEAALAVQEYAEASSAWVFGDALGDVTSDRIRAMLRAGPMTRTEISTAFARNVQASEIDRALALLAELGLVRRYDKQTAGRPAETWELVAR